MKIVIPKGEQVLFKREYYKLTHGGLILPDQGKSAEQYTINTVIRIGDKVTRVKEGDEIIANLNLAVKVDIPDPEIEPGQVLIPENAILAVLKKGESKDGEQKEE